MNILSALAILVLVAIAAVFFKSSPEKSRGQVVGVITRKEVSAKSQYVALVSKVPVVVTPDLNWTIEVTGRRAISGEAAIATLSLSQKAFDAVDVGDEWPVTLKR